MAPAARGGQPLRAPTSPGFWARAAFPLSVLLAAAPAAATSTAAPDVVTIAPAKKEPHPLVRDLCRCTCGGCLAGHHHDCTGPGRARA